MCWRRSWFPPEMDMLDETRDEISAATPTSP
jgi:hypothetical protein